MLLGRKTQKQGFEKTENILMAMMTKKALSVLAVFKENMCPHCFRDKEVTYTQNALMFLEDIYAVKMGCIDRLLFPSQ